MNSSFTQMRNLEGVINLKKKKRQNVKKLWLEKVELIFKWYWVAAKYVKVNVNVTQMRNLEGVINLKKKKDKMWKNYGWRKLS